MKGSGRTGCVQSQRRCVRWEQARGGLVGVQYYFELSAGGTVSLFHHSGQRRGKNALLASEIVNRVRFHAEFPSLSRCPTLGPS